MIADKIRRQMLLKKFGHALAQSTNILMNDTSNSNGTLRAEGSLLDSKGHIER
jgi:hypothetical protein